MRIDKTINKKASSLILFFAGWSVSPDLFKRMEVDGDSDLWICYDYRGLIFNEDISTYKRVHLVAWSLGVWVADYLFAGKHTFDTATAINGTPHPIDDRNGIPKAIFQGTLAHITDEGMRRFNRRMCGDRDTLASFSNIPSRPLEEIREELQYLHDQIQSTREVTEATSRPNLWDRTIIGTADKIFPAENLRRFWQGNATIIEITAPHLPFYQFKTWIELWN